MDDLFEVFICRTLKPFLCSMPCCIHCRYSATLFMLSTFIPFSSLFLGAIFFLWVLLFCACPAFSCYHSNSFHFLLNQFRFSSSEKAAFLDWMLKIVYVSWPCNSKFILKKSPEMYAKCIHEEKNPSIICSFEN